MSALLALFPLKGSSNLIVAAWGCGYWETLLTVLMCDLSCFFTLRDHLKNPYTVTQSPVVLL